MRRFLENLRADATCAVVRVPDLSKTSALLSFEAPGGLLIQVSALRKHGFESVYSAHYKSNHLNSFINPTGNNLFREAFENTVKKHGGTRDVIKHAQRDGTTTRCGGIKMK